MVFPMPHFQNLLGIPHKTSNSSLFETRIPCPTKKVDEPLFCSFHLQELCYKKSKFSIKAMIMYLRMLSQSSQIPNENPVSGLY